MKTIFALILMLQGVVFCAENGSLLLIFNGTESIKIEQILLGYSIQNSSASTNIAEEKAGGIVLSTKRDIKINKIVYAVEVLAPDGSSSSSFAELMINEKDIIEKKEDNYIYSIIINPNVMSTGVVLCYKSLEVTLCKISYSINGKTYEEKAINDILCKKHEKIMNK